MKHNIRLISTGPAHSRAVVAIHGWKGNRYSMEYLMRSLNLPDTDWYFPEAPYLEAGNPDERSWSFEIYPGVWEIEEPQKLITDFFTEILYPQYGSNQVYVVGFSQGALVCFEIILQLTGTLGGIFPIAGFLRDADKNKARLHPDQKGTPIYIGHGLSDDVVPFSASKQAYDYLLEQNANVDLHLYNGGHKIGLSYLRRVKEIILTGKLEKK